MNCAKAQLLMLDHLYGDLRPSSERALLRHLQKCSTCSEEFEAHKATAAAFAKLDMEEPPPGLSSRLVAMAEEDLEQQESPRTVFGGWNWKPVFASVATAALAIFVVVKYVPTAPRSDGQYMTLDSTDQVAQEAAASRLAEEVPESDSYAISEGESTVTYRRDAPKPMLKPEPEPKKKGRPALDNEGLGDDIAAETIVSTEAPVVRGRVGGKAGADEAPDSGRLARAQVPPPEEPQLKEEVRALGYLGSSAEPSGWKDSKDNIKSSLAGEEGSRTHADSPDVAVPASPMYAAVKTRTAVGEVEPPAGAAKLQSRPSKPVEMKVEETIVVGGAVAVTDSLELDRDVAQEEQMIENGVFDAREFNEAVMETEKAPSRKLDKQRTADYMYELGKNYQEQDDCEQAIAVYEKLPEEHPDFKKMADVYISMGECYSDLDNFEKAKRSLAIVHEEYPETSNARLEKLQERILIYDALTFEYAYLLAEDKLEEIECGTAKALIKTMPDDRSNPQIRLKQRDALIGVYFAISRCHIEMEEFEDAISVLTLMHANFPEERESAMQKINEITAMQEAVRKANEQPADAAIESSVEETE
jgi:hypothetical protein